MKLVSAVIILCVLVPVAVAQQPVAQPAGNAPQPQGVAMAQSPLLLSQVEETAQLATSDIGRVRIDKWKADGDTKRQAQSRVESIQRNITSALPILVNQAKQNPNSIAANFKLYRNVKALSDEFATLSEYAGAFGAKDDYRLLGTDAQNFDTLSRTLAEKVENLAAQMDSQIAQLRAQAAQARAQQATSPKKIIVDDNAPAKKPARKKKAAAPPKTETPQ